MWFVVCGVVWECEGGWVWRWVSVCNGPQYDGLSIGHSVGCVAGGKRVTGGNKKIMLMTDAALLRMLHDDPTLSKVSTLMIDEAHERNLNTDIVLGVALMYET